MRVRGRDIIDLLGQSIAVGVLMSAVGFII